MRDLLRTNDPVLLSFATSLLGEAGIGYLVADTHMSIVEGSIGIFPRRVLVGCDDYRAAAQLLREAGLEAELLGDPGAGQ